MLDDALHPAIAAAHYAAIARGVLQTHRKQSQLVMASGRDQGLQSGRLGQWHIAREHHHHPIIGQHGQGLLHGMARTQLGFVPGKI